MTVDQKRLLLLIEDLETNGAPQITGNLHTDAGYCCMGRACVVAMAAGVELKVEEYAGLWAYDDNATTLPDAAAIFFGFGNSNPMIGLPVPFYDTDQEKPLNSCTLGYANDIIGMTFPQIAAALRATYITRERG